jgi:hypothetical protein
MISTVTDSTIQRYDENRLLFEIGPGGRPEGDGQVQATNLVRIAGQSANTICGCAVRLLQTMHLQKRGSLTMTCSQ